MSGRRTQPKQCAVEGCEKVAKSRGRCGKHYMRWLRSGDPLGTRRLPAENLDDPADPRHGTPGGYVRGCQCPRCRDAHTAAYRDYMNRHPEQREKHREKARQHMRRLRRKRRDAAP
jgi:hypothetical protein